MAASSLANRRILVVRPLREQDAFLQLLEESGAAVTYTPIMHIEPIAETQPIESLILEFAQDQRVASASTRPTTAMQFPQHWR